tara:strand:- start:227 stop:805 length:579 start_codon:yes stop_codon:yes gene_type:complete
VEVKKYFTNYIQLIEKIFTNSETDNLEVLFESIEKCFESNGRIFLAGNGGSAAIANHAAADLSKLSKNEKFLSPISLTTNIPQITANSNDDSYENVFILSARNYNMNSNDLIIAISSSGNSKNIINLVKYGKQNKVRTFALLGFNGGVINDLVDFPVLMNSENDYYGPVEDLHMMIFHFLAHRIKNDIKEIN